MKEMENHRFFLFARILPRAWRRVVEFAPDESSY
jgi:hypothetical protein